MKTLNATAALHHLEPDYYAPLTGPLRPRTWNETERRLTSIHAQLLITLTNLATLAEGASASGDHEMAGEILAAARPYREALDELESLHVDPCARSLGPLNCTGQLGHPGGCTYRSSTGSEVPDRHLD